MLAYSIESIANVMQRMQNHMKESIEFHWKLQSFKRSEISESVPLTFVRSQKNKNTKIYLRCQFKFAYWTRSYKHPWQSTQSTNDKAWKRLDNGFICFVRVGHRVSHNQLNFIERNSSPSLSGTGQIFAAKKRSSTSSSIKRRKVVWSLTKKASRERNFRLACRSGKSRSSFTNEFLTEIPQTTRSRADCELIVRNLPLDLKDR